MGSGGDTVRGLGTDDRKLLHTVNPKKVGLQDLQVPKFLCTRDNPMVSFLLC